MSAFDPILVPLDGSAAAARSLGCAAWLAERLPATLHVLSAGHPPLPPREELRRLRVPEKLWANLLLHQAESFPEHAVLEAAKRCGARLIVMTARGESAEEREHDRSPLGHVTASIVESTDVPVLVLPPAYQERLPWTTSIVPISGEAQADEALMIAVRLGNELGLTLTVAHVMSFADAGKGLLAETRYADAAHHEYPRRLDELVERALSHCDRREARCIGDVVLRRGHVAARLLEVIEERNASVIVIGWQARFFPDRAQVLKALLRRVSCPTLLVKATPLPWFALNIGDALK